MIPFNARKIGPRDEDISLTLVYKALDKSEELFDENLAESQKYFRQAEILYNHWSMQTGKGDYETSRKLDDLWMSFMIKTDALNSSPDYNLEG